MHPTASGEQGACWPHPLVLSTAGQHCQQPRPQAGPCQMHLLQEQVREESVKDVGGLSKTAPVAQSPPAEMRSLSTPVPKGYSRLAGSVNMPQQHRHMHY